MGQLEKPDSEHALLLQCNRCGTRYWTDETQANDCPNCQFQDWVVADRKNEVARRQRPPLSPYR